MKQKTKWIVMALFAAALRLGLSWNGTWGHPTDQMCFFSWAQSLAQNGFRDFYGSVSFCDYPPGYFYLLAPLGWLFTRLNLTYIEPAAAVLLRLPAMLADFGIGAVLGHLAYQRRGERAARLTAGSVLFCPLLILNSAVWAQIDSVWCLFLLLAFAWRKKPVQGAAAAAVALLIKPQALLFFPLLAVVYWDKERFLAVYGKALCTGVAVMAALSLPFCGGDFSVILEKYVGTMTGGYPYATVNAFNLYALLGANWKSLEEPFLFATYGFWGRIMIAVSVAAGVFCYCKAKRGPWLSAAVMMTTLFLFGPMMHERYWFPGILMILAAYGDSEAEIPSLLPAYWAAALANFINGILVLASALDNYSAVPPGAMTVTSLLSLAAGCYLYFAVGRECVRK